MILKTSDGQVYKVHFRHFLPIKPQRIRGKGLCRAAATYPASYKSPIHLVSFARGPVTQCWMHEGYCHCHPQDCIATVEPMAKTVKVEARCSPKDVFTKDMGRRVALGRAFKALQLPEETKLQLMADYFRQVHPRV